MSLHRARIHPPTVTGMRSTTGQALAIRYDPASDTVAFVEDDWFAQGHRASAVPPREVVRQRLAGNVTRLRRNARA